MSKLSLFDSLYFSAEIWGGIFSLVAVVVVFLNRRYDIKNAGKLIPVLLCSTAIMLSDGFSRFISVNDSFSLIIARCSHFLMLFFAFLIIPLVAEYVSNFIYIRTEGDRIYWNLIEWGLFALGTLFLIINEFFPYIYRIDEKGRYISMPDFFWLPGVIVFIGLVMTTGVIFVYRKYLFKVERFALLSFLLLPIIAIVMQIIVPGSWYLSLAVAISTIILFISYEISYTRLLIAKEDELMEEKLRIINRQMHPHFIFNSLSLIRNQCRDNPDAIDTIDNFSTVIRSTTDFMVETDCVSVEKELELVKSYFKIQKKRFGECIKVYYDIADTDFDVPPFSIQTLAENSLHHGILDGQLKDSRIDIETKRDKNKHVVTIRDNGVGFDVDELKNQTGNHVGIINTRDRLAAMCDGTIEIESAPHMGTTVTIIIPA